MYRKHLILLAILPALAILACGDEPSSTSGFTGNEPQPEATPEEPAAEEPTPEPETAPQLNPTLAITSPSDGAVLNRRRLTVTGTASDLTTLYVNGEQVWVTEGNWEVPLLLDEGLTLIEATADGAEPDSIRVLVDVTAPEIVIQTPERGTFIHAADQDTVLVSGSWFDAQSSVTEVRVNGEVAEVDGNGFAVEVPLEVGINLIEVQAVDEAGHQAHATRAVQFGTFSPRSARTTDALVALIAAYAFDTLEDIAVPMIEAQISDALANLDTGDGIEIRGFDYEAIELDMVPEDGFIDANVKVRGLRVDVHVDQDILVTDLVLDGSVFVDPLEIDAHIIPTVDDNGVIGIEITDGEVHLRDFRLAIDGVSDVAASMIGGLISGIGEELVSSALEDAVLGDLFDPSALFRTLELFGTTLNFDFVVTEIPVTPAGVGLFADAAVYAQGLAPRGPGPLELEGELTEVPDFRMVNIAVAFNMVNRLLYTMWETGALNINVGELVAGDGSNPEDSPLPLNVGALSLMAGSGLAQAYPSDAPIIIEARPLLPPYAAPPVDFDEGVMSVWLGDMMLDFSVELPSGAIERWASAAIFMEVLIDLEWVDGGLTPTISLRSVVDLEEEPAFDVDDLAFETFIGSVTEMIPTLVTENLNEFGLGSFGGVEIYDMTFSVIEKAPYLLAGASLRQAEDGAGAGTE